MAYPNALTGMGGQTPSIVPYGQIGQISLIESVDLQIKDAEKRLSKLRALKDLLAENPAVEKILELTKEVAPF
jgi:hypothetical protein